jgi:hypothetical protein
LQATSSIPDDILNAHGSALDESKSWAGDAAGTQLAARRTAIIFIRFLPTDASPIRGAFITAKFLKRGAWVVDDDKDLLSTLSDFIVGISKRHRSVPTVLLSFFHGNEFPALYKKVRNRCVSFFNRVNFVFTIKVS